jgi:hypothetical protein
MAIITLSSGIFSILGQDSAATAANACSQLFCAMGSGLMIPILSPAYRCH